MRKNKIEDLYVEDLFIFPLDEEEIPIIEDENLLDIFQEELEPNLYNNIIKNSLKI